MYIYTNIRIYMYLSIYTNICICIFIKKKVLRIWWPKACRQEQYFSSIHIYTCVSVCLPIHTCICMYTCIMYIYIYMYIYSQEIATNMVAKVPSPWNPEKLKAGKSKQVYHTCI